MRKFNALRLTACLVGVLFGVGCTQLPTEKQKVSDMRPQISFKAESERAQGARIVVDGLDMGVVSEYIDGTAALRVVPGTHKITVTAGSTVLLDEKTYLGDGVSRSFPVK